MFRSVVAMLLCTVEIIGWDGVVVYAHCENQRRAVVMLLI